LAPGVNVARTGANTLAYLGLPSETAKKFYNFDPWPKFGTRFWGDTVGVHWGRSTTTLVPPSTRCQCCKTVFITTCTAER